MKNLHIKIRSYAMLAAAVFLLSGCESWLDVTPKSSLKKEELLSTENGYLDVLHGVYIGLVDYRLYGNTLTYGFMDALAQYYDNISATPSHIYNRAATYDYTNSSVKSMIDDVWYLMYYNIANCNVILDNIDGAKDLFTGNNYNRVKAEALALRAFMHFDLLRMYAPAYSPATKGRQGIPYVDRLTNVRIPFSTIEAVCIRIHDDLQEARALLREFDIMGPVDESFDTTTVFPVGDRKAWMNYYAISALLSRLGIYMGDHEMALENALECMTEHAQATKINWAQATQFYYYFYSRERIFSVFIAPEYMQPKNAESFDPASALPIAILKVSLARTAEIYETDQSGGTDWRYLNWVSRTDDNYIIKFNQLSGIPVCKIAELYLIAAECHLDSDPPMALYYLNRIRSNRGLPDLPETADLALEIQKEYAKEFLGEGQLFYFFKRKGYGYIPHWGSAVGDGEYVFPIPDKELEFNQ